MLKTRCGPQSVPAHTGRAAIYLDLLSTDGRSVPAALAACHRSMDARSDVDVVLPSRLLSDQNAPAIEDLMHGAGFELGATQQVNHELCVRLSRRQTLPDWVGAGMRTLICGLNPSIHAADMGVGFGRPGNRFWPAALEAGLVTEDRDPALALSESRLGMTDLVKRATRRADELHPDEYRAGLRRVERLAAWLEPSVVLFVGLAGWRIAVDRKAAAGPQPDGIGGCRAYVMPSTSGLNAHSRIEDLVEHMKAVSRLAAS